MEILECNPQTRGDLLIHRRTTEFMLQRADRIFDVARARAHRAGHPVELAQAVEDGAANTWDGVRLELHTVLWIETFDRTHQTEYACLDQVARIDSLRQVGAESSSDELDQRGVVHDEHVTRIVCSLVVPLLPGLLDREANRQGIHEPQLCPRVRDLVSGFQSLLADVGVSLCGGDIAVTEQLLHCTQVGTVVEEMGGKRVTQCVWVRG